jgi:signal transduction histidine kinase/ligand-binding sensor domain-containing protein
MLGIALWSIPVARAEVLTGGELTFSESGWAGHRVPELGRANCFTQTANGFLWVGGSDGLRRYDGMQVDIVASEGATGENVRRLWVDSGDQLWVATGDGSLEPTGRVSPDLVDWRGSNARLLQLRNGVLSPPSFAKSLPSPWVWAMADEGPVRWFGTEAGILEINGDHYRVIGSKQGLPHPFVTALAVREGTLWIGTMRGLARMQSGRIETLRPDLPVIALAMRDDGSLLVATDRHFFAIAKDGKETELARVPSWSMDAGLAIRSHAQFVALGDQVFRFAAGRFTDDDVTGLAPHLRSDSGVESIFVDRDDNLWVAGLNGVLRIHKTPVEVVAGSDRAAVFGILRRRNNELWISTSKGAMSFLGGKRTAFYPSGDLLSTWTPRALTESPDGRLFLSGITGGVMEFVAGAWVRRLFGGAAETFTADVISATSDGALWVASSSSPDLLRLEVADFGKQAVLKPSQGLCNSRHGPMLLARDGTFWAGSHDGGLSQWKEGKVQCISTGDGLASNSIASLFEFSSDSLLVGSLKPVGLTVIRNGRVLALTERPESRRDHVFAMIEDGRGQFWATTMRGVKTTDVSSLKSWLAGHGESPIWKRVGVPEGLPARENMSWFGPNIALDPERRVAVPTVLGLALIDTAVKPAPKHARVLIDEVRASGRHADGGKISLDPDRSDLEVLYTLPDLSSGNDLMFEHRVDGLDVEWIAAGARRQAYYASVAPGHYRFRVRARDRGGQLVGGMAELPFEVRPFFWQRPEIIAIGVVGVFLLLALAYRQRIRQVEVRFSVVQEERGRIARDLHDNLAQGLTSIALHLDTITLADTVPEDLREIADRARIVLDRVQSEARSAIWDLRAQRVGTLSIADAVEQACRRALEGASVELVFRKQGAQPTSTGRAAALEHELPQIAQEAVTNAIRHGQPTRIEIRLTQDDQGLSLQIVDDGKGFDPRTREATPASNVSDGHFGIVGMRERAARVGGVLMITRNPERGMCVELRIPGSVADGKHA